MHLEIMDKKAEVEFPNAEKYQNQDMKFWEWDHIKIFLYDNWKYNPIEAFNAREVKDHKRHLEVIIRDLTQRAIRLSVSKTEDEILMTILSDLDQHKK